jgi:hypothetical protein
MNNVWKVHNCVARANAPKSDYEKLKTKIRRTTLGYGTALSSVYFITHGAEEGVSATLGVASSLAYIGLLTQRVDNIEKSSPFQKQLLAPVGTAIFETMWNNAPFAFDFDYGATLMGFLAYKVALLTVVYEEVRKMLLSSDDITLESEEEDPSEDDIKAIVIPSEDGYDR